MKYGECAIWHLIDDFRGKSKVAWWFSAAKHFIFNLYKLNTNNLIFISDLYNHNETHMLQVSLS